MSNMCTITIQKRSMNVYYYGGVQRVFMYIILSMRYPMGYSLDRFG